MRGKHPWDIVDSILLAGKIASVVTLICTCTLVWNPYLQTSPFYWGECYTAQIRYTNIQYCSGQNIQQCATPDFTLPTGYQNITVTLPFTRITTPAVASSTTIASTPSSTTATTLASSPSSTAISSSPSSISSSSPSSSPSSTTLTTTTSQASSSSVTAQNSPETGKRRKRSSDENWCIGFPCFQVIAVFKNQDFGPTALVQLWDNYDDLQNYPQCSTSSCDDNDNDNVNNVDAFIENMEQYQQTKQTFNCYINYNNLSQVLLNVNGSYPAAINSILWPILFLIFFFCALLAHRFRDGCGRTPRRPPPAYEATYGVGNAGMGEVAIVEGAGGNYYTSVGMATGVAAAGGTEKNAMSLGVEIGATSLPAASAPYAEIGLEKY